MQISPLLIATAMSRVLTIATQIVVGFYLTPAEFGEFVVALSLCTILSLFQSGDLSRLALQDKNTIAQSAALVRSVLLIGCLATALVVLCVLFLNRGRINHWFVVCLVLLPFLRVMANTRVTLLSAQGDSRGIANAASVEAITRSGVSITLAFAGFGAWSLMFGEVCAVLASVIALNHLCAGPASSRPALNSAMARSIGIVTLSSLFNVVERELPIFAVGMTLQSSDAGSFAFAQRIAVQFIVVMLPMITVESIPRMLASCDDAGRFGKALERERRRVRNISLVLWLLLGACAPAVIYMLWGRRWLGAVEVLPLLAFATLVRIGYIFNRAVLEAKGKIDSLFRLAVIDACLVVMATAVSLHLGGRLAIGVALVLEALVVFRLSQASANGRSSRIGRLLN